MKNIFKMRVIALLLLIALILPLTGCSGNNSPAQSTNSSQQSEEPAVSETPSASSGKADYTNEKNSPPIDNTVAKPEDTTVDELDLTQKQKNSFSMLFYLAITAEEIRSSKDNRLMLEDIYTSLLNDINPGAIDETTQKHLKDLRDIIKTYLNISVKRDRIQYIYNQSKAQAIRQAVPNPLAIISMTNSLDWKRLVTSVAYTVVDSYTNYKNANDVADQEFIMSGWELDDEEMAAIQKNREEAFDYMVDIVQEYGLDGKQTLNEKAIKAFAEISAIESVQEKIHRLEAEEKIYCLLGNYWLELADSYYKTSQYQKCLKAIEKYNDLSTGIYRTDYNYVQILPEAIVAAQNTYSGDEYVTYISKFVDAIIENTSTDEWSIRYLAAQVYIDLYSKTNEIEYLEAAYNIAYDNVAILLAEQRNLNTTYLNDVEEVTAKEPDYTFMSESQKEASEKEYKQEQKRVKAYNKSLIEARETELPSIYEPLSLNCELLFALAEKMNISKTEKEEIEDILQTEKNGVFLVQPINEKYSFTSVKNDYEVKLSKTKIVIPVALLTDEAVITITVKDNGQSITFDDCVVDKVLRKGNTIDTFDAIVSSKNLKGYDWTENSRVTVKIDFGGNIPEVTANFKVVDFSGRIWPLSDKVVFGKA